MFGVTVITILIWQIKTWVSTEELRLSNQYQKWTWWPGSNSDALFIKVIGLSHLLLSLLLLLVAETAKSSKWFLKQISLVSFNNINSYIGICTVLYSLLSTSTFYHICPPRPPPPPAIWTPGVGDGQGGLACYDSWGRQESDTTERLIWSDIKMPELLLSDKKRSLGAVE